MTRIASSSTRFKNEPLARRKHYLPKIEVELLMNENDRNSRSRELKRSLRQAQYERIMQLPLDFMPSPEFDQPGAEDEILAPAPKPERAARKPRRPANLPSYLASLYEVPLLTPEQERRAFRKYNYLKFRASQLRESLDPRRPSIRTMDRLEAMYREAVETKNHLVQANLRLVVSIAKKYADDYESLFDLISEGNMALLRAVEKFDYALGNKFSTYATWAIRKNYARAYTNRARQETCFRTGLEGALDAAAEQRSNCHAQETAQRSYQSGVAKILNCLTDREREIITQHFGLGALSPAPTLKEIGAGMGITKERVRQIEKRALAKLREAAEQARIELAAA
jgi:RNA polymerase primary sigma factor/RNA polymerase sigma factor